MNAKYSVTVVGLACLFASSALAQSTFTTKPFPDVPSSHQNSEAIEYLRTKNILKGHIDGKFHPEQRITRAEMLHLMVNPFFLQGEQRNDCIQQHGGSGAYLFADVPVDSWFAADACTAKVRGLIHGYPDGTFRPGQPVTFVEAAKMIAAVFSLQVRKDSSSDAHWYTAYVQTLGGLYAIPSTIRGLARPVTRGEVAEMLYRMKLDIKTRPYKTWQELLK